MHLRLQVIICLHLQTEIYNLSTQKCHVKNKNSSKKKKKRHIILS